MALAVDLRPDVRFILDDIFGHLHTICLLKSLESENDSDPMATKKLINKMEHLIKLLQKTQEDINTTGSLQRLMEVLVPMVTISDAIAYICSMYITVINGLDYSPKKLSIKVLRKS